jgi:predicted O-methyltransferase YrrM
LGNINKNYIEEYIRMLIKEEEKLTDIREYAEKNNVPIIHPEVKQLLKVLIKIKKPKRILEVGTAIGYSAMVMAESMPKDGTIITIERNPEMIEIAKKNIDSKGYSEKIQIIEGDAENILSSFNDKVDMVFLDGAKGRYQDFLDFILKNLEPEGIIVADNVLFKGMVASEDLVVRRKKTIVKRMRSYLEHISENESLDTSIIPIGDGVAISYNKEANND